MGALSSCCRATAERSWRAVNGALVDAQPLTHTIAIPTPIQSICRGFIGGSPLPLVGHAQGLLFHPSWGHCSHTVATRMPCPHSCFRTSSCAPCETTRPMACPWDLRHQPSRGVLCSSRPVGSLHHGTLDHRVPEEDDSCVVALEKQRVKISSTPCRKIRCLTRPTRGTYSST
jgi:hypothetical protein